MLQDGKFCFIGMFYSCTECNSTQTTCLVMFMVNFNYWKYINVCVILSDEQKGWEKKRCQTLIYPPSSVPEYMCERSIDVGLFSLTTVNSSENAAASCLRSRWKVLKGIKTQTVCRCDESIEVLQEECRSIKSLQMWTNK